MGQAVYLVNCVYLASEMETRDDRAQGHELVNEAIHHCYFFLPQLHLCFAYLGSVSTSVCPKDQHRVSVHLSDSRRQGESHL